MPYDNFGAACEESPADIAAHRTRSVDAICVMEKRKQNGWVRSKTDGPGGAFFIFREMESQRRMLGATQPFCWSDCAMPEAKSGSHLRCSSPADADDAFPSRYGALASALEAVLL